jgi:colanic acid/amylovoran biosynthesis glycosyltransferase
VMLCHALGGPGYSFTVHGPEEFDKPVALHLREKIEHSRFVVAISSFGRSQLYRWVDRAHWPKIEVVHCGLERAFHEVASVPVPAERRLVCVGRLCEQKGQLLLIEAAHLLSERGQQFELVLAGDGEMRPAIEAAIVLYALGDKVRITGWISSDQVRAELLAARALVLPSFAEGLPVVIMEAMALRRPVLTSYVAGIPELVEDGRNGWLFPAGSVEELAAVMANCLSMDLDQLQAMGNAARERVLQRHDIDTEVAKLARHFRDVG